jgi:hypothetical protein
MGLFDKKTKRDDKPNGVDDEPSIVVTPQPAPTQDIPVRAAPAPAPAPEPADYGINKAIELIRSLPDDNMELVVLVVKTTLESANVKVSTIINDAVRKQSMLEKRIDSLAREVSALEAEVAARKREIATLEADYKETSTVKEWLVVAETQARPQVEAADKK